MSGRFKNLWIGCIEKGHHLWARASRMPPGEEMGKLNLNLLFDEATRREGKTKSSNRAEVGEAIARFLDCLAEAARDNPGEVLIALGRHLQKRNKKQR